MLSQRYRIEHVTLQPEPVNRIIHFVARTAKS
jgi:hypothetical protein